MSSDVSNVQVTNNEAESRFEIDVDGKLAVAQYTLQPGKIVFTHTEVPRELSGRGLAQKLASTALDHARSKKLRVVPQCQFFATYIERHPEYNELVTG